MDMKTLAASTATRSAALIFDNGAAALGACMAALYTRVEIIAVIGSIVAATAFCGMLGLFLSEAIPALRIRNVEGRKRLVANWCAGLCAYWTAPLIQARWLPGVDIELVAGLCAAVQSVLGVWAMMICVRWFVKKVEREIKTRDASALPSDEK